MASIYKSQAGKEAVEGRYRQVLQRWPVPNRQVMVPTCQGDTFVIVSGEDHTRHPNAAAALGTPPRHPNAPVVLFHGSGTNSSIWMRDVAQWAQHHRVYAVDMIGTACDGGPGAGRPPDRERSPYSSCTPVLLFSHEVWRHCSSVHLRVLRDFVMKVERSRRGATPKRKRL